jgi:hypothetical protein
MIIDYLREQGGSIFSSDGRGITAGIAEAVGYDDLPTLNGMLARLERDGIIAREIKGKRTYRITLLDEDPSRARATAAAAARAATAPPRAEAKPGTAEIRELQESMRLLADRVAALDKTIQDIAKRRKFWRAS